MLPVVRKPGKTSNRDGIWTLAINGLLVFLLCCWSPTRARGSDFRWLPEINFRGEYDDNVTFDSKNETSDYIGICSPKVTFSYLTERASIDGTLGADLIRYWDETELNTEHQRYQVNGSHQITEKTALNASAGYIKDTTLESELRETGLVNYRENRHRYNLGGGSTYQLNELTSLEINYIYSKTNYRGDEYDDYDSHTIVGQLNRQLNNQRDVITLQPYYAYYDSSASTVDNYGFQLGWHHLYSETLDFTLFGGARYTHTEYKYWTYRQVPAPYPFPVYTLVRETEKDGNWGGVVDFTLHQTGELWDSSIEYSHDLSYGSNGQVLNHDRFTARTSYKITSRFRVAMRATLSRSKSEKDFGYNEENSRYYDLEPSLRYRLGRQHYLNFGYRYAHVYDKTLSDHQKYDRNRVWLSLTFRFPQQ